MTKDLRFPPTFTFRAAVVARNSCRLKLAEDCSLKSASIKAGGVSFRLWRSSGLCDLEYRDRGLTHRFLSVKWADLAGYFIPQGELDL